MKIFIEIQLADQEPFVKVIFVVNPH